MNTLRKSIVTGKVMKTSIGKGLSRLTLAGLLASALFCLVFVATGTASAKTFKTVGGEVVIEAEDYTRLGGKVGGTWFKNTEKKGYKGSAYIESAKKDPKTLRYRSDIIRAEYDIDFKETGTYYLHLRTYALNHTENGFFATMDGKQFNYGDKHAYFIYVKKRKKGQWFWWTDGGGAEKRGLKVSVKITKKGVHTLAILRRDKGTRVDRIWLTKNQSSPQKRSTLRLKSPKKFIR